jgi:hypothetical protein
MAEESLLGTRLKKKQQEENKKLTDMIKEYKTKGKNDVRIARGEVVYVKRMVSL